MEIVCLMVKIMVKGGRGSCYAEKFVENGKVMHELEVSWWSTCSCSYMKLLQIDNGDTTERESHCSLNREHLNPKRILNRTKIVEGTILLNVKICSENM